MRLSDIKTEVVGLAEIKPHDLLIHGGELCVFIHLDDANGLAGMQSLNPGLKHHKVAVTADSLFEKVASVRIHQ